MIGLCGDGTRATDTILQGIEDSSLSMNLSNYFMHISFNNLERAVKYGIPVLFFSATQTQALAYISLPQNGKQSEPLKVKKSFLLPSEYNTYAAYLLQGTCSPDALGNKLRKVCLREL